MDMSDFPVVLALPLGSALAYLMLSSLPHKLLKTQSFVGWNLSWSLSPPRPSSSESTGSQKIQDIKNLADTHETAAALADLIHKDGAGEWPPRANHTESTWPKALRPYKEIYLELSPSLSSTVPSLDDDANSVRIDDFRTRFTKQLRERVNLKEVKALLQAADDGRWDIFPRDVYNAFYCCIATCRHAYRWSAIPVVKIAQLEQEVHLPAELIEPWDYLQRHFGVASDSGNNTSNLVLNFDPNGTYIHRINVGLSETISASEEAFARIFYEVEKLGLPIYHDMIRAVISFNNGDKATCLLHMSRIGNCLRPLLSAYYDRVHDQAIARSAWLSHVQGFYAWGAGYKDEDTGNFIKFDGLSGNQVLLFQALDAFCGLERYLTQETQERNVPVRQREVVRVLEKHSFRERLGDSDEDEKIAAEFDDILKRLRVFRSAHRSRAKTYLSQPAPERLPMTAGKSLLKSDLEHSLEFLDEFMVGRLLKTV